MSFSETVLRIIAFANKFYEADTQKICKPFIVDGRRVGLLLPKVIEQMQQYPEVFSIKESKDGNVQSVELAEHLTNFESRTEAVSKVVNEWRANDVFCALRGWRNECMFAWVKFSEPPLFKMERTATSIFGIRQYGSHINGYLHHKERGLCLWVGKRSKNKSSWPGLLDQMAAGGLSDADDVQHRILGCAKREGQEEASVPDALLDNLKPVGAISYFYQDQRGLFPETQFLFDLEVPEDFTPVNADGEVESFSFMDVEQIKRAIVAEEFKFNCAMIMVDFLIRHSVITPDEEPHYAQIMEGLHKTLIY